MDKARKKELLKAYADKQRQSFSQYRGGLREV